MGNAEKNAFLMGNRDRNYRLGLTATCRGGTLIKMQREPFRLTKRGPYFD
jgi:hypothetical protein